MNSLVGSLDQVKELVTRLTDETHIAIDVETEGTSGAAALDYIDSKVIGLGLAVEDDAWYIDFPTLIQTERVNAMDPQRRDEEDIRAELWTLLLPVLDLEEHVLIAHNAPFDLYMIRKELLEHVYTDCVFSSCMNFWDTMQMATLHNENLIGVRFPIENEQGVMQNVGALSLKALSRVYLGREQRLWDDDFSQWSVEERVQYGCEDVRNTFDLAIYFSRHLQRKDLWDYYLQHAAPQVFVAEHMERVGIHVDVPALQEAQVVLNKRIGELEDEIQCIAPTQVSHKYGLREPWTKAKFVELAEAKQWELLYTDKGNPSVTQDVLQEFAEERYPDEWDWDLVRERIEEPFNHNSRQQLGEYLVSQGCRLPLTPSGQYSTAEHVLREAAAANPGLEMWGPLFEIQKLEKMRSNYIDGVLEVVWPEDDTVHPEWNSAGTTSGRYSCTTSDKNKVLNHKRGPALQTIPNPEKMPPEFGEWGINPREWYIAQPGHKFLVADLAQAEVRMLAVMSKCPVLVHSIKQGGDLHASNARTLFPEWDTSDEGERKRLRSHAKNGTFAVIYGVGPSTLADQQGISYGEASEFLDLFYDTFWGVTKWKREKESEILAIRYSHTYGGRRRSPILLQYPPRVTANQQENLELWQQQKLRESLWRACLEREFQKGHIDPDNSTQREREGRALRQCINHCIQGSVGELINWAAWMMVHAGYTVVLQMHDELVVEVPDDPETIEEAKEYLEGLLNIEIEGIPFLCDVAVGDSWAAGKEE